MEAISGLDDWLAAPYEREENETLFVPEHWECPSCGRFWGEGALHYPYDESLTLVESDRAVFECAKCRVEVRYVAAHELTRWDVYPEEW